ncbi:MAG: class IV adenylate cyclase [Candidatus Hodarchaeales archaeon]
MEVEIKIPLNEKYSSLKIMNSLTKKFGSPIEKIVQIDKYFQSPIRNFWDTDEALRLRRIIYENGKETTELTYKGPKIGSSLKVREEITVSVSDTNQFHKILENLGFFAFGSVKKERINWVSENISISLDNVEGLGTFLEMEIQTEKSRVEIETAKKRIFTMLNELLPEWDRVEERKSYLELLMRKKIREM